MDRQQVYRSQLPYESDVLGIQQFGYEALGLLAMDVLGASTVVAGLACAPTAPASLSVTVGPGRIYTKAQLDASAIGQVAGAGGLAADTNSDHQVLKQGLLRDTATFTVTAPATAGQSQVYLIQAQFTETDDAATPLQFYNTANPTAPITQSLSPARRDKCALALKAGTAAATGSQVAPSPDVGWTAVWAITIANGQGTITAPNIAAAPGAPFLSTLSAVPLKAVAAEILAGVDDSKFTTSLGLKQAMQAQALTDASTIAWNMNLGFRAKVTLTGSGHTVGQPSNLQEGATGSLQIIQDGAGSRTLASGASGWAACWDFRAVGYPTLSTAAGKRDIVYYEVIDAATPVISASFSKSA